MKRICFLGSGTISDNLRLALCGMIVKAKGIGMTYVAPNQITNFSPNDQDTLLISNPGESVLPIIGLWVKNGIRVFIDLDQDFFSLPPFHIDYKRLGPGNQPYLDQLKSLLPSVNGIICPSIILKQRLQAYASNVILIPNSWSSLNPIWKRPNDMRPHVNIGWYGSPSHRNDFKIILEALKQAVKEFDNVKIVIGADPENYRALESVPENRKLFIPLLPYDIVPQMLSYFDILVEPLEISPFNQTKCDNKLMEVGVRAIPWVATPVDAYAKWHEGGILAKNETEVWFTALKELITSSARRRELGEAGRMKSLQREHHSIFEYYLEVL